ncbi:hypothetical protein STRIC_0746 [Streptococcus ictaluri 707-05]|uniref:HTH arsR-type domain-containing protein n=2 Tax=Streptococcus ictaluri TaxID=380397 RepID=G5JZN3_9STRE|nr:hypothetical protein STRIC_0746 [Streptococcus ictaluri 707-05]
MRINYSETSSDLVELSYINLLAYDKQEWEWDFSTKEQKIFQDVFPVLDELHALFRPYQDRIKRYYLMGDAYSLWAILYFKMLSEGLSPQEPQEIHDYALAMSDFAIQELLTDLVKTKLDSNQKAEDFLTYLEVSSYSAENKWYFSQFYRNPSSFMKHFVTLSEELIALYLPYLERSRPERRRYAQEFSIAEFLTHSSYFSESPMTIEKDNLADVYILSPWMIRFHYFQAMTSQPKNVFILSCRMDLLLESQQTLNLDTFTHSLKILSDPTRYAILAALTKPHAKSKTIAQELDITGAAVSFHTQKLINAHLLLASKADDSSKYRINANLLKSLIAKLEDDFQLKS